MGSHGGFAPDADEPEDKAPESRPTVPAPPSAKDDSIQGAASGVSPADDAVRAEQAELERFGSLRRVPRLAIPLGVLREMKLDQATGFLVWLVDGKSSLEELLDVCAMPRIQALRLFGALRFLGIIEFEEPRP